MREFTFEEIKNFENEKYEDIERYLASNVFTEISILKERAIFDLEKIINGEEISSSFSSAELKEIDYITLKIIYLLVANKFEKIEEYAEYWYSLFSNYFNAFPILKDSKMNGLLNLLKLKNNISRLINLSEFIIFKKEHEFSMVSDSFIKAFLGEEE